MTTTTETKFECDRCAFVVQKSVSGVIDLRLPIGWASVTIVESEGERYAHRSGMDLCPRCARAHDTWLKSQPLMGRTT